MAKRYNPRGVSLHDSYTLDQVADSLGVHTQTVRGWVRKGLPCLRGKKPFLILGAHLQPFLKQLNDSGKLKLEPNQIYCLRCRAGKIPAGNMADFDAVDGMRGRLIGICPDCNAICNRFVKKELVADIAPDLDVNFRSAVGSLNDTQPPALRTHIK